MGYFASLLREFSTPEKESQERKGAIEKNLNNDDNVLSAANEQVTESMMRMKNSSRVSEKEWAELDPVYPM